ncbi:hypothetical protein BGX27_009771 [Mortierella sp. AM989]|nr:hypothetical protein BGX27_009771 [Mortierella sp. AM989]
MSKHVYPPWHNLAQKIIFVVAVILCIALPVTYGDKDNETISSTTVIVVLVLYFVLWAVFTLIVRFGIESYVVESKLPIHTPTPAPPVLLHTPGNRNAIPSAPAIKISSSPADSKDELYLNAGKKKVAISGARISEDVEDANRDSGALHQHQPTPQKGLRFMESPDRHQFSPSPSSSPMGVKFSPPMSTSSANGALNRTSIGVKFNQRPGGLAGESIDSEESYPTFASYRQSQHASFDMFKQRIRNALETANSQRQRELQEQQEKLEQSQSGQVHVNLEDDSQNDRSVEAGSTMPEKTTDSLAPPSALSPNMLSAVKAGRPRSSSAASMISNLSEKIRLGSNFFGRAGRSRAGSDASVHAPPTTSPGASTPSSRLSFSGPSVSAVPTSEPVISSSSTTTMAAIASAAAVASAMSLPRHSAAFNGSDSHLAPDNIAKQSKLSHPLAQTLHVDDKSQDDGEAVMLDIPEDTTSQEGFTSSSRRQQSHISRKTISGDDRVHVLSSEPDIEVKIER